MKILICSLTYPLLNGVTVSVNRSMDGFKKRGVKTLIIGPDYKVPKVREEHKIAPSSLIIKSIGVLIGKEERTFGVGAYSRIKEIAEKFNPDAYWLHTITWAPNAFERFMFKSKKPKVIFYHTMVEEYGRIYAGRVGAATMKMRSESVCNKADAVIIPSQMMKDKLLNYGVKTPIHVIPTGIDIPSKQSTKKEICKRYNIDPESTILLHVGRVSKEKNLEVLVRAAKDANKLGLNVTLLFVGPGDTDYIAKEAEKIGMKNRTVITGSLSKIEAQSIYGACDVFVFSSQTETQGLVIGEAMAAGIPVVALDSPIQKEVYPRGTAVIIDNPSDFGEKLVAIMKNDKKRSLMIEKAKEFVTDNFSEKRMIDNQLKVFKDLIG